MNQPEARPVVFCFSEGLRALESRLAGVVRVKGFRDLVLLLGRVVSLSIQSM